LGASCHVVAGARVVAHANQHDCVQRAVGLAVSATVESVTVGAPGRSWHGAAAHRWANEASEASLSGLSPAVISNCPAVSVPTPCIASKPGAVRAIRTRRSPSASAISSLKCRYRLARRLRASLTAVAGSARSAPGRLAASRRTSSVVVSERSAARTAAGAVMISDLIWLMVWVRALTALARTTRKSADRLDRAIAALRDAGGAAREDRGGGGVGVDTLAAKHRSSVSKMAAKHKARIDTPNGPRVCFEARIERKNRTPLVARFGGIPLQRQRAVELADREPVRVDYPQKELIARLLADTCEICGSKGNVQVHHVRALADLAHAGWQPSDWARVTLHRRRKTVVACDICHDRIHSERPARPFTP